MNPPNPWGWWGGNNKDNIENEVKNVRNWLSKRTDYYRKSLCDYYKVGTLAPVTVNKDMEDAAEGHFIFNGVELSKGTFDGKFIIGRKITLEPGEASALHVTGWEVTADETSNYYQGERLEIDMPQCKKLVITALSDASGIGIIPTDGTKPQDVYDLNGRKVRSGSTSTEGLPRGIYIVGGKKVIVR